MHVQLKQGVKLQGLRPEMCFAMIVAYNAYTQRNVDWIITSALDGKHSPKSYHGLGLAFDNRIHHISFDMATEIYLEIKEALGDQYDVILHDTHIHIEFDPER